MKKQGWMIWTGVSLAVGVTAIQLWRNGTVSLDAEKAENPIAVGNAGRGFDASNGPGQRSETAREEARGPASIPSSSSAFGATAVVPSAERPFPYERELTDYIELKAKVLMSDAEKKRRAELLANADFLRGAGELLRRPAALETDEFDRQARAMDLLLEALSSPSKEVAASVLRSVVEDAQIENERLDMATRQALAGVKAEVMYHWSAIDPEGTRDLPAWLPGPVSRRIWQNVIEMQEENLRQSAEEL